MKKIATMVLVGALGCCVLSQTASAVGLTLGSSMAPTGTGVSPSGSLVVTETSSFTGLDAFSVVHFTGTLMSSVYYASGSSGPLTFVYKLTSTAGPDSLGDVTINQFAALAGATINADYIPGAGSVPSNVARSSTGVVDYSFIPKIGIGGVSDVLVITTSTTSWAQGSANVIDGGVATMLAYQPAAPGVPDGGMTVALLGFALTGLGMLRRKLS